MQFGLIGEKLGHSISPAIHKKIFDMLQINASYNLFPVPKSKIEQLGDWIKIFGIAGLNVTIPYKEKVINQLDYISQEAKDIGAVNTIANISGKLHGYNTDYYGLGDMLNVNNVSLSNKIVTVLGTGGSSKAVLAYLKNQNTKEIYLVSRIKTENCIDYSNLKDINGDIIINTTPLGMYPNIEDSPVSSNIIEKYETLIDLIYNPEQTQFLKIGANLGKKTISGMYMLISQAAKSAEIWHKREITATMLSEIQKEVII